MKNVCRTRQALGLVLQQEISHHLIQLYCHKSLDGSDEEAEAANGLRMFEVRPQLTCVEPGPWAAGAMDVTDADGKEAKSANKFCCWGWVLLSCGWVCCVKGLFATELTEFEVKDKAGVHEGPVVPAKGLILSREEGPIEDKAPPLKPGVEDSQLLTRPEFMFRDPNCCCISTILLLLTADWFNGTRGVTAAGVDAKKGFVPDAC